MFTRPRSSSAMRHARAGLAAVPQCEPADNSATPGTGGGLPRALGPQVDVLARLSAEAAGYLEGALSPAPRRRAGRRPRLRLLPPG